MRAICAAQFRHKVALQSRTTTVSALGEASHTWSTYAQAWASVEPLTGREYYENRATQGEVTHKVTMRYRAGIGPEQRIVFRSRNLEIVSVRNIEERDRLLVLDCRESL